MSAVSQKDDQLVIKNWENYHIDWTIKQIYVNMPFLGYLMSSVNRVPSTEVPTAAMSPDNRLFFNKRFMSSQTLDQAKFILLHEILHKAHFHFGRADAILQSMFGVKNYMVKDEKFKDLSIEDQIRIRQLHSAFNITMDVAINQLCEKKFARPNMEALRQELTKEQIEKLNELLAKRKEELKQVKGKNAKQVQAEIDEIKLVIAGENKITGWFLETLEEKIGKKLEPFREFEYYFEELMKSDEGHSYMDVHTVQFDIDPDATDQNGNPVPYDACEEEFKGLVRKASEKQREYEAASGIGADSPNSFQDILPDMNFKVNDQKVWKAVINNTFGEFKSGTMETTLRRPNRRNDEDPFGRRRRCCSKRVVVCLDTSGSVANYVPKFFGAINRAIKRYGVTVDLLLTDTSVYGVYENLSRLNPKMKDIKFHDYGGTHLITAQQWIIDNRPKKGADCHLLVLTDGYTDWMSKTPFTQSAIYTECHEKLDGICDFAIMRI